MLIRTFFCFLTFFLIIPEILAADWLIDSASFKSEVQIDEAAGRIVLTNGLVRRTLVTRPAAATLSLLNLSSGEEYIRALSPEGFVTLDGQEYSLGGLRGAPVANYFKPSWLEQMKPYENSYRFVSVSTGEIEARFAWKKRPEWLSRDLSWPPKGKHVVLTFQPPEGKSLPTVEVHYEIYDGIPLLSKWLTVKNTTETPVKVDSFAAEELRLAETGSSVDSQVTQPFNLHIESDYIFGGIISTESQQSSVSTQYTTDSEYPTQVNYERQTICKVRCTPNIGPAQTVKPGESFESFRVFELLFDSTDRERRGLAVRRMYRTIAPWTAENPLMFHKTTANPDQIRDAVAQCKETGFELIIMSFGSGFNLESTETAYRERYKALADEARKSGVALGGYSLTSSRGAVTGADNVKNPSPRFGVGPCLGSKWGQTYVETLRQFMDEADFEVFENDGPYPGDYCTATDHPGHVGKEDSVWVQWKAQSELYKWCRSKGIYVNQPDSYFLSGGNKTGMGYRETNWSLPREEQLIIERQNIYDGTWTKLCSMGWMFVPLSQYHGGGAAATIEPLHEHLEHYDARFANLLGSGVQACYRGPRLYDTPETLAVVQKWVRFYKTHRQVLDGDLIHVRRATGRDWDGWVKINPDGVEKGLAFLFNPLKEPIDLEMTLPLYYTGLTGKACAAINGQNPTSVPLDANGCATLNVTIPAESYIWILFTEQK